MPIEAFYSPPSTAMAVLVVTSGTRPTAVSVGQHIYETDTGRTLVYNGTNWHLPWNMPWGVMDTIGLTNPQTGMGASNVVTDVLAGALTVTVVANRRIRVSVSGIYQISTSGNVAVGYIREGSTTLARMAQKLSSGATENNLASGSVVLSPSAGSHTYKISFAVTSGAGTISTVCDTANPFTFTVEDIGPATNTIAAAASPPVSSLRSIVTSGTRPDGVEGQILYETDTDRQYVHNGTSWLPAGQLGASFAAAGQIYQNASLTTTVLAGRAWLFGKFAFVQLRLQTTQAGTTGSPFILLYPTVTGQTISPVAQTTTCGSATYHRSGASKRSGSVVLVTTSFGFMISVDDAGSGYLGQTPSVAAQNGDVFEYSMFYEVA